MCAINGFNSKNSDLIRLMNQAVSHRGPDGTGFFCDEYISLGHNLLAISDKPENSIQPVKSQDGNFALSYNGEIYNYKNLRRELEIDGDEFITDSDTEVLFKGLARYGLKFLNRIDGMFAIAWYDFDSKTISIARDRMGMKPLYYFNKDGKFIFSSEIKGILVHDVVRRINRSMLPIYLSIGYVPGSETMFSGIKRVRPGEIITFNLENNETSFSNLEEGRLSLGNNVKEAISKSVIGHTMGLRPFGLYLSGGLDSTVILHELVNNGVENVNTFSTRFDVEDEKFNEDSIGAKKLSDSYKINHTEVLITEKDLVDRYSEAIKVIEEPRNNPSISSYLILAEKASQSMTVILTGDGGDEMFGGYRKYLISKSITNKFKRYSRFLVNLRINIGNVLKGKQELSDYFDLSNPYIRWLYLNIANSPSFINRISAIKFNKDYFIEYIKSNSGLLSDDFDNNIAQIDTRNWLADEDFIRNDKIMMRYGMEGRFPFVSSSIYLMSKAIPSALKMEDGVSKSIIRKIYRGLVPDFIIDKRKTGWNAPANIWMESYFGDFVRTVLSRDYYDTGLIDLDLIKDTVLNKDRFTMTDMAKIMSFVSFQVWAKEFNMK